MLETSARLLRLLALLQTRRDWNGPQLAEALSVTTRTVRKDVNRLRALGYPVNASAGVAGGYRLGAGTSLPPLLLDDEEAVAVTVGLRTAAAERRRRGHRGDLAARARQARAGAARRTCTAGSARCTSRWSRSRRPRPPSRRHLTAIAAAIRDHRRLRFDYEDHRRAHHAAHRRAAPARAHARALVPRRVGRRPRRLADLPRRPDAAAGRRRRALHAARRSRRGPRRLRRARRRLGDVAPPGAREGARAGRAA